MAAGIFISYRRDESRHAAGRLADDLSQAFGAERIFRDIEGIELGVEFAKALEKALASCSVMLVLIGPQWLDMPHAKRGGRRLDQPDDWIRQEIATALKRDVRVVPVLLEGATLPDAADLPEDLRPLAGRQAMELSDVRWRGDLQRLVEALGKLPGFERQQSPETDKKDNRHNSDNSDNSENRDTRDNKEAVTPSRKKLWWSVGAAVLLVGGLFSALEEQQKAQGGGSAPWPPAPVPQQGFPTGYGMQVCSCVGPNPAAFAPEARCASGQVRMNFCAAMCPQGFAQVAYVCS